MTAREDIYEHYSALLKVAKALKHNIDDAKDLLHDTIEKALKNINKYDKGKGTLYTWLVNTMKRINIDNNRRVKVPTILFSQNAVDSPYINMPTRQKYYEKDILKEAIEYAKQRLDSSKSVSILFMFLDGMKYKDICAKTNLKMSTVKARINSAKKQLRNTLIDSPYFETLKNDGYI